ncbi:C45 family peptidase [Roseibium sp. SCP14]|uniref:C45 family peptidase n=1 Tax=Roseibium sp. SCP14 TaxID=3141375 RepID=UPI00333A3F69
MTAPIAPLIEVSGPAPARGEQYGRAADTRIRAGLGIYEKLLLKRGLDWPRVLEVAQKLGNKLKRTYPLHIAEIEGIARGAQVHPGEILLLNSRSEVLNLIELGRSAIDELDDGCTSALALPEKTKTGRLLHGQNWDWRPECAETTVVLAVRRETGPDILTYVEAGGLARAGLNSAGIAVTGNNLSCDDDGKHGVGTPISVIRRLILEAPTFADALKAVCASPRTISNNMTISCATDGGQAINLETTPKDVFWSHPEAGVITHANHFTSAIGRAKVTDLGYRSHADTLFRDHRLRKRLTEVGDPLELDHFKSAFRDDFSAPNGVLRTPQHMNGDRISATVATLLMDAEVKHLAVCQSPYHSTHYETYTL